MEFDTKIEDVDIESLLDSVDTTITVDDNNTNPDDANDTKDDSNPNDLEKTEDDDVESGEESELSDEEMLYNQFANELYKKGILDSYENIKSEDDLYSAFQESIKANELKDLTEQQKIVLDAFRNGIPEEDIILNQKEIADYSNISIEDVETKSSLRENILMKFYLSKGMDEKEARDLALVINDSSAAIEKTTDALNKLKEDAATYLERQKEENERLQQEQIKEMQKTIENIQGKIKSIEKIDNMKISEGVRNRAFETLTKAVGVDDYGNQYNKIAKDRMEDPVDFEARVALFYELTNGFRDFKNISKTIQTKEATKLGDILKKKVTSKSEDKDFSFLDRI